MIEDFTVYAIGIGSSEDGPDEILCRPCYRKRDDGISPGTLRGLFAATGWQPVRISETEFAWPWISVEIDEGTTCSDCGNDPLTDEPPDESEGALCNACSETFTADEWEDRHTDKDGEDVHARCCTEEDGQGDDSDDETSVEWKPSDETLDLARHAGVVGV